MRMDGGREIYIYLSIFAVPRLHVGDGREIVKGDGHASLTNQIADKFTQPFVTEGTSEDRVNLAAHVDCRHGLQTQ